MDASPPRHVFILQGTPLPLSAAALRAIAARQAPIASAEAHAALAALLRTDLPGGYTAAAFDALPPDRRRVLMTLVHRAALAGVDRHPAHRDGPA